jgi:hypothetical protein
MSDQTHLTNFSGDKKAWPVYITIGNLTSTRRNKPGSMAVLLLALLPVPPKFAKSSAADKLQRQINADTLRGVFELIFRPLRDTMAAGVPVDCADGKIRQCFPILSGWIADHMENVTLHGIKSNACPKCEVGPEELGTGIGPQRARDYARYERLRENCSLGLESDDAQDTFETLGIKMGQNVFQELERVSAPDLHKPDLLHTIYLGLFKHMMDWIQAFLKKHARQQAFDDAWKALPPYPGFFVPKKAYREVTQWQGKEMRNLGRCLLGVLAVALRQPDHSQLQPFKRVLICVGSLLDFTMMAQYRSHTDDTIQYMEDYANLFHQTKDIFLEFRISKRTQTKADELRRELRQQQTLVNHSVAKSNRRRVREQDRAEENDQRMDLIYAESNFNFIKMHLISHFRDHIYQFGNIPMYSTEFGELAHKEQIKDGWRRSNKIDAARQILSSYGRQHAIRMRLLNLEFLRRAGADLPVEVTEHLEKTCTAPAPPAQRRILKGRRGDIRDVIDLGRALDVSTERICRELTRYSRLCLPLWRRLPEDHAILRSLPVELLTQLEVPVPTFQETDVYEIHRARCTGDRLFRNQASRNDCVWIQAGGEQMYGALRGRLPAKLLALFKIRDYTQEGTVCRLAGVQLMTAVNSGRPSDVHGLVAVELRQDARELTIVDIGTILGLAHLIPETDRRWLVNSRIDLRTFNEIY